MIIPELKHYCLTKISDPEKQLIELIHSIGWGKIEEITIQDGQPKCCKQAVKTIKFMED